MVIYLHIIIDSLATVYLENSSVYNHRTIYKTGIEKEPIQSI
jgi:hypothetical protein